MRTTITLGEKTITLEGISSPIETRQARLICLAIHQVGIFPDPTYESIIINNENTKVQCGAEHTTFQPSDTMTEWHCPKCGRGVDVWDVNQPATDSHKDCTRLHDQDELECAACGHGCTGKQYARHIAKKLNQQPCPTCHGKGMVPGNGSNP
jgi:DNA-directed RNA polymerase subunit RPC12/RpoP